MALRLKGINATLSTFRECDRRFKESVAAELERGAKEIAALARAYAPIDRGDLVKSIRAQRVKNVGATRWKVKVGGVIGGRDVSEYALAAHEGFSTNRPSWSLGKKSMEKAQRLGVHVGPGYLSRAFRKLAPTVKRRARDAVNLDVAAMSIKKSSRRK